MDLPATPDARGAIRRDRSRCAGRRHAAGVRGRDALYKSSVPVLASILNDTTAAVIHSDFELAGTQFVGRYFLSLVNFRKGKVCIDLPLPVPQDPLPQFTMRADTLIALVQHVGDAAEARTFMVHIHVDAASCSWNYFGERL